MVPRPDESIVASAFRTSDGDKPNCRAIRDGVMPALKAARTALTCPRVNETATGSGCRFAGGLSVGMDHLPLRFASASATASNRSSSSSSRCLTALGRSLGKTCRGEEAAAASSVGFAIDETYFIDGQVGCWLLIATAPKRGRGWI
jgi:hypothetical protein